MSDKGAENWRERDRKVLWHPFTQHNLWEEEDFPVIVSGEGAYIYDADGNRYLDGISSLWLNVHGHRRPEIDRAIKDQLDRIAHSTYLGQSHPPGIELAERLVDIAPGELSRVFYSDDGSTAMEIAVKLAYQYWCQGENPLPGKHYFIKLANAYHGDTIGSVSVGGMDLFHATYRPLLFPTITVHAPYCHRCHLPKRHVPGMMSQDECEDGSGCLDEIEAVLKDRWREVAGIVIEPIVQGAAGMVIQPEGFLAGVRELCDEYGVLMICDEVAVGFGRTGKMFACEHEEVGPDIMAVGKGITGGYLPLAATLATEEVFDAFRGAYHADNTFFHGHSYTGNQLACAAALASLDIFDKDETLKNVEKRAEQAQKWLMTRMWEAEHVGDVRQIGLMMGIELERDPYAKEPYPVEEMMARRVILAAREKGVIIRPLGDTIILMPPLCITEDQLEDLLEATYESIREVTE